MWVVGTAIGAFVGFIIWASLGPKWKLGRYGLVQDTPGEMGCFGGLLTMAVCAAIGAAVGALINI